MTPMTEESRQREDLENQVWNAIAAFEQIVETIPNDRVSLEALSHAYGQVGDLSRAREYLTRLITVVIEEKDRDAVEMLRDRMVSLEASDPLARETLARMDAFLKDLAGEVRQFDLSEKPHEKPEPARVDDTEWRSSHVTSELSFAWTLFQAGELTQEDYAMVAQDLSTISTNVALVTVSVLHAIHDRGGRSMDRILAFSARDSGVPMIPLSLFEVQDQVFQLLPREFIIRFGVLPFEMMGNDILVVLLNPYNKQLRDKTESMIGRRCHFFITAPAEFDAMIEQKKPRNEPKPEAGATVTP
jgi:Type II secretion system (T2SS), protein E, N-terminal domain